MLNNTTLQGRLVATPELKTTPTGLSVTNFTLACDRGDKDKTTDFIDIVAWRQTAEFIVRFFGKGDLIIVQGSIQTRSYEAKDGSKRKAFEIVVDKAHFAGKKESSAPTEQQRANLDGLKSKAGLDVDTEGIGDDDFLPF